MAYYPKQRNVSGIFFHGNAGADQILETSSSLIYNTGTDTLTVGNLDGNATTATTALDASGLTSTVTVQISDELTGSATFQDAGDTANVSVTAASALISNRTETTSANSTDYVLLLSGTQLRKITKGNFVSDLGGGTMSSWDISVDNGAAQTVTNAEQVDFSGAGNITITQDESSSPYRVVISGNDQVNTYTAGSGITLNANTFDANVDPTIQTEGAQSVTSTAGKTYAVQVDSSDYMVVNVPWTNTTYTAGSGLVLNGTTIDAQVDNSTIEINSDTFRVKDGGITNAKLSNSSITFSANAGSDQVVSLGQTLEISGGAATNTTMSATNIATIDVKYDNQTIGLSSDQLIVKDSGITEVKRQRTVDSSFSNGEVISSDINLVNASAGSILLNLPSPPVSAGRLLYIKKTDSSSNTVTIDQNSSETIDGGTQYLLYNQYEAVTLICDGTNWHVF